MMGRLAVRVALLTMTVFAAGCARSTTNVHAQENHFAAQAVRGLLRDDVRSPLARFDPGVVLAFADLMKRDGKSPREAWMRGVRHNRCVPAVAVLGSAQTATGACYVYDIGWDMTQQPRVRVRLWLSMVGQTWKVAALTYHVFKSG
jgi:hypothetical protein